MGVRKPTLRSVAEAAGVSTATVSYAFSRPDRVSAEARTRVLAVAGELGYAGPDAKGRSLRTGRTGAVGVIFTTGLTYAFTDPYVTAMLAGLAEALEPSRTSLMFIPFGEVSAGMAPDQVRRSVDAVHRAMIDGAVADGLDDDHPAVRVLAERGIPLVRSNETAAGPSVVIDDRQAGRDVGRHLAGLGHRDIVALVATPHEPGRVVEVTEQTPLFPYSRLRLTGLRESLPADTRLRVISGGSNSALAGQVAARAVLRGSERPTAIAADSDVLAAAVAGVARERGLWLGAGLSLTGFDDQPVAAELGLTTVRQPVHRKGFLMGRMLVDPDSERGRITLPTELVVRRSTGPAPSVRLGE
ncbi:LacI family DNA-binding transcriptional regulator [Paractinoplanes hotanensis]|uniref:LacI family transcriptional regulator n=1 Tax=Paractinoplanes hotanensis TaxID=2906497 RepID=A0ABT0XX12_9ACTN|nr:LacI family DNA-binding transcriptional regulator [Actinoplanes hotanensis]MCM4077732.1 LacI family transcriptional regulator [Actinoplanes hotanensis]